MTPSLRELLPSLPPLGLIVAAAALLGGCAGPTVTGSSILPTGAHTANQARQTEGLSPIPAAPVPTTP